MVNEEELTGEVKGDFTQLRVDDESSGQFVNMLDLIASGGNGPITSISGGQGIAVSVTNGVATIINTAQNQVGPAGPRGIPGLSIQGERGPVGDSIKGDAGLNGLNSAMQSISVGNQTFASERLAQVVFPGATANLADGVLTLDSMQDEKGDSITGSRLKHCNTNDNRW